MNEVTGSASTALAMQFFREGKLQECVDCANAVVLANPEDAQSYMLLGAAYTQLGDTGMAIGAFQKSVETKPTARAYYNLGTAYEKSGRPRDAADQFQKAVDLDPGYTPAADALNRINAVPTGEQQTDDLLAKPAAKPRAGTFLGGEEEEEGGISVGQLDNRRPVAPAPTNAVPPGPPPDIVTPEQRQAANEVKIKEAHKKMITSGLAYGTVVGPIGLMGTLFLFRFFSPVPINLMTGVVGGIIFGAIVGLWIGFISGDESDGAKVGALVGTVSMGIMALLDKDNNTNSVLIITVLGAGIGAIAGYFIGMMVSNSIGE